MELFCSSSERGSKPPPSRIVEHLIAFRAWRQQYLPGRRKPDVLRPGIVGMRGSTVSGDYGIAL